MFYLLFIYICFYFNAIKFYIIIYHKTMKEDFIVYLWKYRILRGKPLQTVNGERLEILSPGQENPNAGPDFLAASVRIGGTLWVGNVEIHVRSSQWFLHKHHTDRAYSNIILHVVYIHDKEVLDKYGQPIPHLEAKNYFDPALQNNYNLLQSNKGWIPCQKQLKQQNAFILNHWIWRLVINRLERKAEEVNHYLKYFGQHKEKTLLFLLSRSLGGKPNATAFGMLVQRTSYELLLRNHDNIFCLEALLFGQAGMLERPFSEEYPEQLRQEHIYQKKKHDLLPPLKFELWKYARMRPYNFPDLRIAQLAMMIHKNRGQLFGKIILNDDAKQLTEALTVAASNYWSTHYRLGKSTSKKNKTIGESTIQNILTNTVAPISFVQAKENPLREPGEYAIKMLEQLPPEDNNIIRKWVTILPDHCKPTHAADTQGLLELKKYYCLTGKCLKCMIGHQILGAKNKSVIN